MKIFRITDFFDNIRIFDDVITDQNDIGSIWILLYSKKSKIRRKMKIQHEEVFYI